MRGIINVKFLCNFTLASYFVILNSTISHLGMIKRHLGLHKLVELHTKIRPEVLQTELFWSYIVLHLYRKYHAVTKAQKE